MQIKDLQILRYDSFILLNNFSTRLHSDDIVFRGNEIINFIDEILFAISHFDSLKYITMTNNLFKIQKMVEQSLPSEIAMTRFFNKIGKKHQLAGNLGERFVSLNIFLGVFTQYDINSLVEKRTAKGSLDDDDIYPPKKSSSLAELPINVDPLSLGAVSIDDVEIIDPSSEIDRSDEIDE